MKSPLFILIHLGLGDAILCNGLIRVLVDRHESVIVPAYPHNFDAVAFMFSDDPRIKVVKALTSHHAAGMASTHENRLMLGFYAADADKNFDRRRFDQEFYSQANVPFDARWGAFRLPEVPFIIEEDFHFRGLKFAAVHDDCRRGFTINRNVDFDHSFRIEPSRSFFRWIQPLRDASQVHCIDSSILCLWDSMPHVEGQKLFLHRYARNTNPPALRKPWEIIS